jgi:hypothetical protein
MSALTAEQEAALGPRGRAALRYVGMGWSVIPLKARSKVPATRHGLNDWTNDPEAVARRWTEHPECNVAVVCGQPSHGLMVIDLDVDEAKGKDGKATLAEWETTHGKLPDTLKVVTGSGGIHLLYTVDMDIHPSANAALGVDIRCEKSYVVAPPSIHPNGQAYEWVVSPDDMDPAEADGNVLAFVSHAQRNNADVDDVGGQDQPHKSFKLPKVIDGDRNSTLFSYACQLRESGRPDAEIEQAVVGANMLRCKPPLEMGEVEKIIRSSLKYEPGGDEDMAKTEGGFSKAAPKKNVTSIEICHLLAACKEISEGVKFNELEGRPWKVAPLPWDKSDDKRSFNDRDLASLWGFVEYGFGIRSSDAFRAALQQYYMLPKSKINPIQTMLATLDKVKLTDNLDKVEVSADGGETWTARESVCGVLMSRYLDAELTEYNYEVERLMFRQIVARGLHPGCKADHMVVIVGKQGIGKSSFVRALAMDDRFYLEGFSRFDTKGLERLLGMLVVEVSEMDGFTHNAMSAIKSIITTRVDNYKKSYDIYSEGRKRSCVFVGTTNDGGFLTDKTGNRRFLPIECLRATNDANPGILDGHLDADVRQAMAETIALHDRMGWEEFQKTMVLPDAVRTAAEEKQEKFTQEDDTLNDVRSYLDGVGPAIRRVNVKMVMCEGMGYDNLTFSREQRLKKKDVADALNHVEGWHMADRKETITGWGTSRTWVRNSA